MTTTDELKARSALANAVGIARAWREMADDGRTCTEADLLNALALIEEAGCEAMPWLREVA